MTIKPSRGDTNIIIAGVGGQGSITAGQIAARAADLSGLGIAMSEVHGMAQRGGSVLSTVRYGNVQSPVVTHGEADFLLAFEKLEALRYASHLCSTGISIVADQRITPSIEALKKADYPCDVENKLQQYGKSTLVVPALDVAEKIGNSKLMGTVILGSFSAFLDIPTTNWEQALSEGVPPKTVSQNIQAFKAGQILANAAVNTHGTMQPQTIAV